MGQPKYANTRKVQVNPTVSTAPPYTAGDVVGGLQRLKLAVGKYRRGTLQDVIVREVGSQKAPLTLLFFRSAPGTVAADNTPFSFAAADVPNCVAKVNVLTTDYETVGGQSVAHVSVGKVVEGNIGDIDPGTGKVDDTTIGDLWLVVVTTGTPTYGTTAALTLELGILAD